MTVSLLVHALAEHLLSLLATYHTAQGAKAGDIDGEYKPVNVYEWYVPLPDQKRRQSDYPFIEIRPYHGKRTGIDRHALVELTFGVFFPGRRGARRIKECGCRCVCSHEPDGVRRD
ncbi:hypothetical protein WJ0W_005714 [Paenibacillus melissococcoides]|uniref:Uncharacterized protein n=1 Tax=Paenibacillus melissococcoides TaxID=2912268 RepID=A0ABM9GA39_9BACL|nr:hypothetical protein [Paenibacillus melissococcoides]CAH8248532.1 hypothetical protein WJ0W_005714 [Paenibacillus melissococcoides]